MEQLKTYWHLAEKRRIPSSYEVGTSRLLYYPRLGIAVDNPVSRWFERYQQGTPLVGVQWDSFNDPRETTYRRYVELQHSQESFVDGLFAASERAQEDQRLDAAWMDTLQGVLPVLRFPCHALQMVAAYCGQLAPEGKVAVAFAFQAGDEMRRIQRIAYRMRQLQTARPLFGSQSKTEWCRVGQWQPLRELMERLLVTYDFGEAWTASNLVVKPAFDHLFLVGFTQIARSHGDIVLSQVLASLASDAQWSRDWNLALARAVLAGAPQNAVQLGSWCSRWWSKTRLALESAVQLWGVTPEEQSWALEAAFAERASCFSSLELDISA